MKPGDCFVDTYYEPDTIVLKVSSKSMGPDGYACTVIYTSVPNRMEKGQTVTRYSDDEELIPIAMITIDDKVILIKL